MRRRGWRGGGGRRNILFVSLFLTIAVIIQARQNISSTQASRSNNAAATMVRSTEESTADGSGAENEEKDATPTASESSQVSMSVTTSSTETPREATTANKSSDDETECIKPAIQQFPRTVMGPGVRKHGGFVIHVMLAVYTFLGLAIVCDEFFVPSLERISDVLKLQSDVAGATFMAAGSSAPELATALIGVFVAKDDIGVSGVIGSAVFNIMFVISLCALMTQTVLYLNWWPLFRDCFFYMLSILALLLCIYDESITWYESIFLLVLYGLYIYAMYMNTVLEAWAHTLPIPFPIHDRAVIPTENSGLVTYKVAPPTNADGSGAEEGFDYNQPVMTEVTVVEGEAQTTSVTEGAQKVPMPPESVLNLFSPPEGSVIKRVVWRISLPLIYMFYYTVPDCRLERWHSWFVVTFCLSMVWIAILSYLMVWMITVVGYTFGVPDTVMGLTFVAAGVSVPDALSSLAVIKEGLGDMAVSNAVGSNVFDILVCLGLPWFLATVVINPGDTVTVKSRGLTYSTLSLFSTVAFLLLATHYNGWQLNKRYGVMLMIWYLLFMILASLYEMNVFGKFNPPECMSDY